jgi:predicted O-methyltransferase YrrM
VTSAETDLLRRLAADRSRVAELGVYEGATSAVLARAMKVDGTLYLVDPFLAELRIEQWLGRSLSRSIARRSVRGASVRLLFIEALSIPAADQVEAALDLVFVDADHSYSAVRADFETWRSKLAPDGRIAFHDSRLCSARPDPKPDDGPVRLMEELRAGSDPGWSILESVDSTTVVGRSALRDDRAPGG